MGMTEVGDRAHAVYREQFGAEPAVAASAPGRVNLIGEHIDYFGGKVLPFALPFRTAVAAGPGSGGLYAAAMGERRPAGNERDGSWADYLRGVAWALSEEGHALPLWQAAVVGEVPIGAGLSSSAALEAAAALALSALAGAEIERTRLAVLCQRADNDFIGIASGIMDQYASLLGREGHALLIDCATLACEPIPCRFRDAGLTVLITDTRVERHLAGSEYNERRAAGERAARALSCPSLRDATLGDLERLEGVELRRARHVLWEMARVVAAADALRHDDFATLGRLMNASHDSLRIDYEVSTPELDAVVAEARAAGALGARLTGAGFGGCAIALIREERVAGLQERIRNRFASSGWKEPVFYTVEPAAGANLEFG